MRITRTPTGLSSRLDLIALQPIFDLNAMASNLRTRYIPDQGNHQSTRMRQSIPWTAVNRFSHISLLGRTGHRISRTDPIGHMDFTTNFATAGPFPFIGLPLRRYIIIHNRRHRHRNLTRLRLDTKSNRVLQVVFYSYGGSRA